MEKSYIYVLLCPYTQEVRYVGQSIAPYARYQEHIQQRLGASKALRDWIASLDTTPILEIIDEGSLDEIDEKEKTWIAYYHKNGFKLLNHYHIPIPETEEPVEPRTAKFRVKTRRVQIDFSKEELDEMNQLAVHLHKAGVFGVTKKDGTAVKREVIRYVVDEALKYYRQQESD